MIDILRFREYVAELVADVNSHSDIKIDNTVIAVKEEHMIKKIRDKSGVCLCVNYPDVDADGDGDNVSDSHSIFFFLCEKVTQGSQNDESEMQMYGKLQKLMLQLRKSIYEYRLITQQCVPIIPENKLRIEWEYQIFGGCNGLSLGLKYSENG